MKTIAAAALCLALCAGVHAEEAGNAPKPVRLQYELAVGADGKVTSLAPAWELPAAVDQWIRQRIATYAFKPASMNGQPQPATTTLYVSLTPVLSGDGGTGYRIDAVSTGPKLVRGKYKHRPDRPGAAYFLVDFDAQGRVTKASVDERQAPLGGSSFRSWGLALARSFRFKPETIAGQGVPSRGVVPIIFCGRERACPDLPPLPPEEGADLGGEMIARSVLAPETPTGS